MEERKQEKRETNGRRRTRRTNLKVKSSEKQVKAAVVPTDSESEGLRKFGLDLVGKIPWGTHLCQFYETKEDLIDILVPYFAEGLKDNEFCMWVTSPPLEVEEATKALERVVPDLDSYFKKGQIAIVAYTDWYLLGGKFDSDRVLQGWGEKEKDALSRGFEGLRLTGNTFWIERNHWRGFTEYEATVNEVIGSYRMIALCTYALRKCTGSDVVDVMRNHVGTLIRKGKDWNLVEDVARRRKVEEESIKSEGRYRSLFENMVDGFAYAKALFDDNGEPVDYVLLEVNDAFESLTGLEKEKVIGKRATEVLPGFDKDPSDWMGTFKKVATTGDPVTFEHCSEGFDRWYSGSAFSPEKGCVVATFHEMTGQKRMEEALKRDKDTLRGVMESAGVMLAYFDRDFNFLVVNSAYAKGSGHLVEDLVGKNHFALFPSEENKAIFERVRDSGEAVAYYDKPFEFPGHPERGVTYWDWTLTPVKDRDGSVEGLVLSLTETTQRKKAEQELEGVAKFPMENPDPILRISREGILMFSNPAGFSILKEWRLEIGQHVPLGWRQHVAEALGSRRRMEWEENFGESTYSFVFAPLTDYVNVYARNITERRRLEDRLYESEKRYRTLYETMMDGVAYVDMNGRFVECNEAYANMLGYSREELKTLTYRQLMPEKWHAEDSAVTKQIIEKGYSELFERELIRKNGEVFLVNLNVWLNRDENGQPIGMWSIVRDITRRKAAENALKESQADLNRAQAVAKTGSWRLDVRRNELVWSDETHRMFGIPKGTPMTYDTFLGTIHPDDRAYVDEKWKEALQSGLYDVEHRIVVDGEVKWVREKAELEFDKDGGLLGGFGTVQDITERKHAEQELREAKRDWERTFDSVPDLIAILDDQHRIVRANRAMALRLGLTPEQCAGLTCFRSVHGTNQPPECCPHVRTLQDGQEHSAELRGERLGGDFLVSTTPLMDEQGNRVGAVHVSRDITERKMMERKLEEYASHLEELVKDRTERLKAAERLAAIGETAGMVGHDIRNPLQTVEGAVFLAREELKSVASRTKEIVTVEEMLDTIEEQTLYVDKIVTDLQYYAKPLTPQLEETDLQQLISETLSSVRVPQNVELTVAVEPDCSMLTVDRTMMKRILTNLVTNAIDAMPNGGKLIIRALKEDEQARISVQDTGAGILEENGPHVFQPLFSTKAKGQGFGLAVVKRLVEAHNGEITFGSQAGKGTTFTIIMPIAKEVV